MTGRKPDVSLDRPRAKKRGWLSAKRIINLISSRVGAAIIIPVIMFDATTLSWWAFTTAGGYCAYSFYRVLTTPPRIPADEDDNEDDG